MGGWFLFGNSVLEETRWIVWSLAKTKRKSSQSPSPQSYLNNFALTNISRKYRYSAGLQWIALKQLYQCLRDITEDVAVQHYNMLYCKSSMSLFLDYLNMTSSMYSKEHCFLDVIFWKQSSYEVWGHNRSHKVASRSYIMDREVSGYLWSITRNLTIHFWEFSMILFFLFHLLIIQENEPSHCFIWWMQFDFSSSL